MVEKILIAAGFVKNETFKECRFLTSPKSTYAVYDDEFESRGSDDRNYILDHAYTIEMYSSIPDPEAEKRIQNAFNAFGIPFKKQDRYWIQDEQLYQVIFNFDYVEKLRRE